MKEIKLKIECQSCQGTGVYQGMAERDGAAVICHTCKGTGCQDYTFRYNDFEGRIKKRGVERVYLSGYGYCISPKPITLSNGTFVDFPNEGVSYGDFLKGNMPKHIKQMGCPMMADQGACHNKKGFVDNCGKLNGSYLSYIPSCKHGNKMECWDRFEKEAAHD